MENTTKQAIIVSIINFLHNELVEGCLNDEKKESIDVAIQCLETAFEISQEAKEKLTKESVDLVSVFPKPRKEASEENKAAAETAKNKGNSHMKNQEYNEAVAEYSKAIELNPNNAIYYCNRAAAYSRLEKHWEAIADCQEAIKLDPAYGKAYGRLGIAYSNLQKYEEARKAYVTALAYDPNNSLYETNLKLAEEKLCANSGNENSTQDSNRPVDISELMNNPNFPNFINNPNIINMATQMLSDPNFCNMMTGLIGTGGNVNFDSLLQLGRSVATRMRTDDPNIAETVNQMANNSQNPQSGSTAANEQSSNENETGPQEKKGPPANENS